MIYLAVSILQMDLVIHDLDISFVVMVFATSISGSNLFTYCYYGKYATESFAAFANCSYKSNWIVLPNDLQKYFVIMIAYSQIPAIYHGYNIVNLSLETFTTVTFFVHRSYLTVNTHFHLQIFKNVISYYLVFKTEAMEY